MIKELKYFFFVIVVFLFFFLTSKYYFSNENIKKSYRSYKNLDTKISKYDDKLIVLKNDTGNIIEYADKNLMKKKKKYFFWDLLNKND
tara:strand:+ start:1515 stop:1778 length:264 start_codon:yes stop_codon:yes gene_type:complete